MDATDGLACIALVIYLVPVLVVLGWPLAQAWKRGPDGVLWRYEDRGDERWLIVWTPKLYGLEDAARWALDRLDEQPELLAAEQQWPDPEDA